MCLCYMDLNFSFIDWKYNPATTNYHHLRLFKTNNNNLKKKNGGKTDNAGFFSHDSNKNITESDGIQTNVDLKVNVF